MERSLVLLSRLTGLSKFHKLSGVLGLETKDLNGIVETVDCLYLLSHKILIYANDELEQFLAFSKWLRHEIDIQSAEPMSQTLEELLEKSDMIDHQRTLKYIQGAMTKSALQDFIQPAPGLGIRPAPSTAGRWAPSEQGGSFYEEYKQLLAQQSKQHRESQNDGRLEIPKLNDLTSRLGIQCDKVFAHIALTQRRGILHRSPLALHSDCDESVIDMTMRREVVIPCFLSFSGILTVLAGYQRAAHLLYLYCSQVSQVEAHMYEPRNPFSIPLNTDSQPQSISTGQS